MRERPILMDTESVRAILAGRKTETRRPCRTVPVHGCPHSMPGDRLWVREAWAGTDDPAHAKTLQYRAQADGHTPVVARWRPSIHMPRWASRLFLRVVEARVERLQEIDGAGCWAEGYGEADTTEASTDRLINTAKAFCECWDAIHGRRAGLAWTDDPWVWVIRFEREERT